VSNSERRKGAAGELEVAAIFRAAGFDCYRTPNSGGLRVKGDLAGTVPAHVEVKRQEVLRLPLWLRQAETDAPAGVTPVVAFRQSRGQWYAALPLDALAALMANQSRGLEVWEHPRVRR
jgi:Holliday junction resolvase